MKNKIGETKSEFFKDFDGIVLINKELSISSYDVIRKFKKVFF
jgi:tRNA U55 pseudouridine synthase TruB